MCTKRLVVGVIGLCMFAPGVKAGTVLVAHYGETSVVMPSISPADDGTFNITYIQAFNYHNEESFVGRGDLLSAKLSIGTVGTSISNVEQLNTTPIMVGFGGQYRWANFMKPFRRENLVAWAEYGTPLIHYYDFTASSENAVDWMGANWSRQINPRVSNDNIAYWSRTWDGVTRPMWKMHIINKWQTDAPVVVEDYIDQADPAYAEWQNWAPWARTGDIHAEPGGANGRVVYTKFGKHPDTDTYGFAPYWSYFEVGEEVASDSKPLLDFDMGMPGMITNLVMSDRYVVWQQSPHDPMDPMAWQDKGPLFVAQWMGSSDSPPPDWPDPENPDMPQPPEEDPSWPYTGDESYEFVGELWMGGPENLASMQEPALFGSYLVYTDEDGHRIVMRNLDEGLSGSVTVLVEDLDAELGWPAVWVDENTGDYVVLYQSSHSPADLMVLTSIPEPASLGLLALGGLALLRRRRRKPGHAH